MGRFETVFHASFPNLQQGSAQEDLFAAATPALDDTAGGDDVETSPPGRAVGIDLVRNHLSTTRGSLEPWEERARSKTTLRMKAVASDRQQFGRSQ